MEPRVFSDKQWSWIIKYYPIALGILFAAGVVILYVWNNGFSTESQRLAEFGSYFGGVMTPVGIFVGWISYHKWQDSEQKTSNYLIAMQSLQSTNNMIKKINTSMSRGSIKISKAKYIEPAIYYITHLEKYKNLILRLLKSYKQDIRIHEHHRLLLENEKKNIAILINSTSESLADISAAVDKLKTTHETEETMKLSSNKIYEMELEIFDSLDLFLNPRKGS